jgi:hypothetical protein
VREDRVLEPFLTIDGRRGAGGALKLDEVARAAGPGRQPLAGHSAFDDEVEGDERGKQPLISRFDPAIDEDHRNPRPFGLLEYRFPAGFNDRRQNDGLDALATRARVAWI